MSVETAGIYASKVPESASTGEKDEERTDEMVGVGYGLQMLLDSRNWGQLTRIGSTGIHFIEKMRTVQGELGRKKFGWRLTWKLTILS